MIELQKGKKHLVVKRDGRLEPYNPNKMYKVCLWMADGNEILAKELINDVDIKVHDKIKIEKLFDEVIETAANKIDRMFPIWDNVAKRGYLQKIYKEVWGIKRDEYPPFSQVLAKGLRYGKYDREVIESFTEEEIEELGQYIKPSRDFNFSYLGLRVFMDKYSKDYAYNKPLELPQHGFMRLAMFAFWKERKNRLELIKKRYDDMSLFRYSEATPKWLNSLTPNPQLASCVLMKMPDDSWGINRTSSSMGLFSKYGGGLAVDISALRCEGSSIRGSGKSSGPVPFIKVVESVVSAYDQLGKRKGACAVYFNWWHYNAPEMIELKEEGGTEDRRARKLQYAVKWNRLFTKRILANETITLFDPKETPELLETYGEEFEYWYQYYENKPGIRKRRLNAVEFAEDIAKQRIETGNIYIFFDENVQEQSVFNEKIHSSNLCVEVLLPTKASAIKDWELFQKFGNGEIKLSENINPGQIALCNLSSINLLEWESLNEKEKNELAYNLLLASDNQLDYAYYPVPEGEIFNKLYRAIGIGQANTAQWLASKGLRFTDEEAIKATQEISEDIAFIFTKNSIQLAKERGTFAKISETTWAEGVFPFELSKCKLKYPLKRNWEVLRDDLITFGVRFSTLFAVAPTATSASIINATEGIEPLRKLVSYKTGTYDCKQLAPNIQKYGQLYDIAWDIPSETLMDLAAARQPFIEQSQSLSLFYKDRNDSAYEIVKDIIYAETKGLKTLYYAHSPKDEEDMDEECESCST